MLNESSNFFDSFWLNFTGRGEEKHGKHDKWRRWRMQKCAQKKRGKRFHHHHYRESFTRARFNKITQTWYSRFRGVFFSFSSTSPCSHLDLASKSRSIWLNVNWVSVCVYECVHGVLYIERVQMLRDCWVLLSNINSVTFLLCWHIYFVFNQLLLFNQ